MAAVAIWLSLLACIAPAGPDPSSSEAKPTTYVYKKVGACDIKADVYRPGGSQIRPAVMLIHGGAMIFNSREWVNPIQVERYLQAGCVVVSIDYRLAPETKLPAIVQDVKDAYRWMREKGPKLFRIDAGRIAVVGDSAGGFLALMSGFCLNPPPKAVVSFYGYGDIRWTNRPAPEYGERVEKDRAYGVIDRKVLSESPLYPRVEFYNYCRQNGLWMKEVVGLDPVRDRQRFDSLVPIKHVTARFPPTLLLHGDQDIDVPYSESVRMAAELKRHRVTHRLITMKGYNHLFDVFPEGWPSKNPPTDVKDRNVLVALDEAAAFLKKHLVRSDR